MPLFLAPLLLKAAELAVIVVVTVATDAAVEKAMKD